jgi:hypothetical protein
MGMAIVTADKQCNRHASPNLCGSRREEAPNTLVITKGKWGVWQI